MESKNELEQLTHANRWFERATKDFHQFKRMVPFDKKTRAVVRCSDPALATYLLQQTIEKLVKSLAIASGQYTFKEYAKDYGHNSLALIVNLFQRACTKIEMLGLSVVFATFGLDDLSTSQVKLEDLEGAVVGKEPLIDVKTRKPVDFLAESANLSTESIDRQLDLLLYFRELITNLVAGALASLRSLGIRGATTTATTETILRTLTSQSSAWGKAPGIASLSGEQLKGIQLFIDTFGSGTNAAATEVDKRKIGLDQLGVWSMSMSLYILCYMTYAHEHYARYPREPGRPTNAVFGCEDYTANLGIVNRIARVGYVTGLTLNDLKVQLAKVNAFFAAN